MADNIDTVAVVGTGVIGRGWAKVFARAGMATRLYDQDPAQAQRALAWLQADIAADVADGLATAEEAAAQRGRLSVRTELAEALAGAGYVQESGPERLEIKQAIFAAMDRVAAPATILASSTSALDINKIAGGLAGVARCIMAHPFNPPFALPAVEILAARDTAPATVDATLAFLRRVGMQPVVMNFYVPGFLANRIQAAVVREAIHLAESGVADVDAIDAVIRDGLGLRWALFGNFGTNNTNADGGVREYYRRYGGSYRAMMDQLDSSAPSFDEAMIERIGRGVDAMEGGAPVGDLCRWRDLMVQRIRKLKRERPSPGQRSGRGAR